MKKKTIFKNKYILWTILSIVSVIIIGTSFIIGYNLAKNQSAKKIEKKENETQKALKELQKLVDENINKKDSNSSKSSDLDIKQITDEIKSAKSAKNVNKIKKQEKPVKKVVKNINSEAVDYAQNNNETIKRNSNPIIHTNKPKLVIIMDDMSFAYQVKNLKNLHMKITPSFFPPTSNHPNTAKYAKEFKHYMVHFPMQATNPNFHEEPKTLHIDSNYKFIESRVTFIKKNFPNVEFVNNHTGSKFTSNLVCMQKLYKALDKYNLIFIDSVTTPRSKAPLVAKENHKILLQRDVFLDNFPTVTYIRNQLKQAVKVAKKRGYAIAICHPQRATFQALKKSKDILKGVELIYVGDMYEFAKKHHLSRL